LINIVTETTVHFEFGNWQLELATMNIASKFLVWKLSNAKEILMSQVNLLLSASAVHEIADAMIHRHYAQRAYPDNGRHFGLANKTGPCGGWLCIAPDDWRCLGHALYATTNDTTPISLGAASNWQVTVFQSLAQDPILYLASCWPHGYFTIFRPSSRPDSKFNLKTCPASKFTALTLINSMWKPNAFGGLNFQNPVACINTDARLEVAVTLSIMNAGAMHPDPSLPLVSFLENFMLQLDVTVSKKNEMQEDSAFQNLFVPRWIFPVIGDIPQLISNIGIVQRTSNHSEHDATLHHVQGMNKMGVKVDRIKFEMKDRQAVSTKLIVEIAAKICRSPSQIGICSVRKCPLFWTNQPKRKELINKLRQTHVGVVYLVRSNGDVICEVLDSSISGRFVLVQIDKE
jgi:hypothetical protein